MKKQLSKDWLRFLFVVFMINSDFAKLSGAWSSIDEKVGGPVKNIRGPIKLLYVIIFEILESFKKNALLDQ